MEVRQSGPYKCKLISNHVSNPNDMAELNYLFKEADLLTIKLTLNENGISFCSEDIADDNDDDSDDCCGYYDDFCNSTFKYSNELKLYILININVVNTCGNTYNFYVKVIEYVEK